MSCPLLDKLAPETRNMIYEYVLSFDTPLKHVARMQPFVKKLTGVKLESRSCSNASETETTTDLRRVNTSILTANKPIYVEAIAVFYDRNTIHVDARLYTSGNIISPRATDLSLTKQVVVPIDDSLDPVFEKRVSKVVQMALTTIPAMFPNLRTCSLYVFTDTAELPSSAVIAIYYTLRQSDLFGQLYFDGVGSVTAIFRSTPCIKLIVQSRWTIARWDYSTALVPDTAFSLKQVSANALHRSSRAYPQSRYPYTAHRIFETYRKMAKLPENEDLGQDGYEFWTCIDACLCLIQRWNP